MEMLPLKWQLKKSLKRSKRGSMAEEKKRTIKKTFVLSELDVAIIKTAAKKCGYFSDSETLRAIIKYFADNAPCFKLQPAEVPKDNIRDLILKGR